MTVAPTAAPLTSALTDLLAARTRGVLATIKRDGRPQLSVVDFTFDPRTGLARTSVTDRRAKVANLRRDARASLMAATETQDGYVVAEGEATLTPPSADPYDATVAELVEVYRTIRGEHPDWADYRDAMVADRRMVLAIRVDRVYGLPPGF